MPEPSADCSRHRKDIRCCYLVLTGTIAALCVGGALSSCSGSQPSASDGGTSPESDGGASPESDGAGADVGAGPDASGSDDANADTATGCNLVDPTSCGGGSQGCLADYGAGTTHCGTAGGGTQGKSCVHDTDCAAGYACNPVLSVCTHWCTNNADCQVVGIPTCHFKGTLQFNGQLFGTCS
jgi:hypothetical protein